MIKAWYRYSVKFRHYREDLQEKYRKKTLNPKVLAEGSTTATQSPKPPEPRERQRTSWSLGKAGQLTPSMAPCRGLLMEVITSLVMICLFKYALVILLLCNLRNPRF